MKSWSMHVRGALAILLALLSACGEAATAPEQVRSPSDPPSLAVTGPVAVNRDMIAHYAWANVYPDGSGWTTNPFCNREAQPPSGNSANFASQAILGGLVGSMDPGTVYAWRGEFQTDRYGYSIYQWYHESCWLEGSAWSDAHKLYEYARNNRSTYRGLHFGLVTYDTPTAYMDHTLVRKGDIIFADWEHDGRFDHVMVVIDYNTAYSGYNRIRVAYQKGYPKENLNERNKGLGDLNVWYKYQAVFHVYRPLDYNPNGL